MDGKALRGALERGSRYEPHNGKVFAVEARMSLAQQKARGATRKGSMEVLVLLSLEGSMVR